MEQDATTPLDRTEAGLALDGLPAPPTPENIAAMMDLYPFGERFFQEFTRRQVLLNAAKNGAGPLPLAFQPGGGPSTAKPAATTASLRPRRARSRRAALPLPRARVDYPARA